MKIAFHGAARTVTGSKHLVTLKSGKRVLLDCGMFQGSEETERANAEPFGFDPASIDMLLLTHAHLDHCGRIPLLVRRGFRGRILATAATRELTRVVLLDSAGIQEEDARRAQRSNQECVFLPQPALPQAGNPHPEWQRLLCETAQSR